MPFFENISLEISGNDFNSTTNVNKKKLKFQISNPKSKIPEADVTNNNSGRNYTWFGSYCSQFALELRRRNEVEQDRWVVYKAAQTRFGVGGDSK